MAETHYFYGPHGLQCQGVTGSPYYVEGGIALMYDRECGTLLKHGAPDKVREHFDTFLRRAAGTGLTETIEVLSLDPTFLDAHMLDEVNKCVQISGYVARFAERLKRSLIKPDTADAMTVTA